MEQTLELLRKYGRAAWRRRWLGLAVAWAVCGLGWLGQRFIPNSYQSSARLYVDADVVLTPLLKGLAVEASSDQQLAILQQTLLSRPNLDTVIAKTDLGLSATTPTERELLEADLAKQITIKSEQKNLFSITYRNTNPRLARDVVQSLLSIFTESATASKRRDMENAQVFLRQQIASYEQQLRAVEQRRAQFHSEYAAVLPLDNGGSAATSVDGARAEVDKAKIALQEAEGKEKTIQAEIAKIFPNGAPPPRLAAGGAGDIGSGEQSLAQAELRLREMQTIYTDDYPGVIAQKKLVEQLRKTAGGGPGGVRGGSPELHTQLTMRLLDTQVEIASRKQQLADAQRNLDRIQKILQERPTLMAQYQGMNRDYDILKKNYDDLVERLQSANLSQAADTQADKVHLRVVDPPQIPLVPYGPNRLLIISGVLVIGILAGIGAAAAVVVIDRSFASSEELRDIGAPVLGSISAIGRRLRARLALSIVQFAAALVLLIAAYGGMVYLFTLGTV
ncbi:MAG TPA: XrtA system polysaccharide chain length determinant [Acetobacteraceae bacterium]|nr:XrtA system polysaccharide chain length determinant [Acetobacteraceae bacterium]